MSSKRQRTAVYRAAIVGVGRIGSTFDAPRSRDILSHAHAFRANRRTELVGFVEANAVRGRREARRWRTAWFDGIDRLFEEAAPDIVVIATPDETHADLLEQVARFRPRVIVCEKPPVRKPSEVARVERAARHSGSTVVVNYTRRFDTTVCRVREQLAGGVYGSVMAASCVYTKGLLHNGSHLVDLARFLFGEMRGCVRFPRRDTDRDGSVSGVAAFQRCPQFHIMTADERRYSIVEFDILAERARLRFTDAGAMLTIQRVVRDPVYAGYRALGGATAKATALRSALPELVRHVVGVLDGTEDPRSTLADALGSYAACAALADAVAC